MDIVHHSVIGFAGYRALSSAGAELEGMAFMAASVLADTDVAFMALGKRFYLRNHQGPTHSLLLAPLFALALAWALSFDVHMYWGIAGAALAGFAAHYALDLSNTFGISLLWPVSRRRFSTDGVFFIDLGAWLLTLGCLGLTFVSNPLMVFASYAAVFAAYITARLALQRSIRRRLGCTLAVPSGLDPFRFFILTERDSGAVETFEYHAITGERMNEHTWPAPEPRHLAMARTSGVFNDIEKIVKYLFITEVREDAEGTTIVASDLGVRNFGGRFGRTTLRFDPGGRLVDETAYI